MTQLIILANNVAVGNPFSGTSIHVDIAYRAMAPAPPPRNTYR